MVIGKGSLKGDWRGSQGKSQSERVRGIWSELEGERIRGGVRKTGSGKEWYRERVV